MNIVFFTHPSFQSHQSMPRFASMLADGMTKRGHNVTVWAPKARFRNLPVPSFLKKWFGYIDQYVVFPMEVRRWVQSFAADTLFVFTDHALGPWVPLVAHRPHVIHCHDFLAQRSALGQIQENRTGWSGRKYQAFIHNGYSKGKHFISVSDKTKGDLHEFLPGPPLSSERVYNGLNQAFVVMDQIKARNKLSAMIQLDVTNGFILHVGGNQWYKNRKGVIEIYNRWRSSQSKTLPLLLIGHAPDASLEQCYNASPFKKDIYILTGLKDEVVRVAYCGASVFLFPSLAEGFGWPVAEAMASGCPVITTGEAPMTEVAGTAAVLIPIKTESNAADWSKDGALAIEQIVNMSETARMKIIKEGLTNASRFDAESALTEIEKIYSRIIRS